MPTATLTKPFITVLILLLCLPHALFAQKPTRRSAPRPANRSTQINDSVMADLLAMQPLPPEEEGTTETSNEAEAKPPADNAPIKELIAYWSSKSDTKPSEIVQQRLLEAVLNRPELIVQLMPALPNSSAAYDQIYQMMQEESDSPEDDYWKDQARRFLQIRSQYFREDLLADARSDDLNERHRALIALAKVDWEAVQPMVEQMMGSTNPEAVAAALAIHHKHALRVGETQQAESILAKLKATVSNRQVSPSIRSFTLSNLMESEWPGQEEWFLGLFADPTLSGSASEEMMQQLLAEQEAKRINAVSVAAAVAASKAAAGARVVVGVNVPYKEVVTNNPILESALLTEKVKGEAGKWIPKVIPLVGNADRNIHNAAVKFLIAINGNPAPDEDKTLVANRQDAARALLPWLNNPLWASGASRDEFVDSLNDFDLPEAVPGLLTILDSESDRTVVDAAIRVLIEYKSPQAVGNLKRLLQKETDEQSREPIITAIALCGGFSDEEMATTFEAYARKAVTDAGEAQIGSALDGKKNLPLNISIGRVLYESDRVPATEELGVRLFARAKELRFKEPAVAQKILSGIQFTPLQVAKLNLLERIGAGNVDAAAISFALDNRRDWQKGVSDAMYPLITQGGYAAGIAAVLLGEQGRAMDILQGKDTKAQLALLAAARHVREKLPVTEIASLLSNPLLTKAAESYLEIENSAAARNLIWARHPKQAWIVGEGINVDSQGDGEYSHQKQEKKLQQEVLRQNGKLEIYAVLTKFYGAEGEENGNIIIRVQTDEAEISMPNMNGYRTYRKLTSNELQDLKLLIAKPEIRDLGPELFPDKNREGDDGPWHSFLHLNQERGRRISFHSLRRAPKKDATPHEALAGLFYTLNRTGDFKIRYDLEDKIPGLEVLYSNAKQRLLTVAQEGKELRVLVGDYSVNRQRSKEPLPYDWRSFDAGRLGGIVSAPAPLAEYFEAAKALGSIELLTSASDYLLPQIMPKQKIIYSAMAFGDEPGIWKTTFSGERIKVREGNYVGAVVTPDEKWLVTTRMAMGVQPNAAPSATTTLVRLNLQSGEELPVALPVGTRLWARMFVPMRQQVLLGDQPPFAHAPAGKSFLIDPTTGKLQTVKGELRPLLQSAVRPLQPTGKLNEVWASVYDDTKRATAIGRYNMATFAFTSALELPGLGAQIREMWVDEAAGKIYFIHDGNLLRMPLPK